MAFVQSPHAAGDIVGVGAGDTGVMPDVRTIYSGDDLAKAGFGHLSLAWKHPKPHGSIVGTVLNHAIAERQLHDGVVQGVGRKLSSSFMDYAMPRALVVSYIDADHEPVTTPINALGAKAVGEARMFGAIPVLISAVCDALANRGVEHRGIPATPKKTRRALPAGE